MPIRGIRGASGRQHEGQGLSVSSTCCDEPRRELEIPAELERLRETRDWANQIAMDTGLSEDDCFQVKLAMSEAVTNAIIHGSARQSDTVRIVACKSDDRLVFKVTDPGRVGADGPVERLDEGGRGLELVSMVMDEVELERTDAGGSLRFSKKFAAA